MTVNKSLWHINTDVSELVNEPLLESRHENSPGMSRVYAKYSMISNGTERLVAKGKVSPKLASKMAVPFMEGGFELPIKYGYSLVGETTLKNNQEASLVHLLHPHQQITDVPSDAIFELPKDCDARRMTLISNMETIINAIWDAEHILTEGNINNTRIGICGFGNIGALLALTMRALYQLDITIIEADQWRLAQARRMGFNTLNPSQDSPDYDLLWHSSCTQAGLNWCIAHCGLEATLIELSWFAAEPVSINLGENFHYNRVTLRSSQVSQIPKSKHQESYFSRKQFAIKLLNSNVYDALFSPDIPFEEAPLFFEKLRKGHLEPGFIWCIKY